MDNPTSTTSSYSLPSLQLKLRPGIVEFGWGHPNEALLPVDAITQATAHTLRHYAPLALNYGASQGPGSLIARLSVYLGRLDGITPPHEQLFITGGNSQGLDLLCTLLTHPGDIALVEAPTYHLALRILRDHGLRLVTVPSDTNGLCIDALTETLAQLQLHNHKARILYTVPTFGNPTGISLAAERRTALVDLAQRDGIIIIEDDVYRELWYDEPAPPALFTLAPAGPVIRLGSFAKILAPGLRLGWMLAAPEIVKRCVDCGLLDSGGGINHFTAQIIGAFMELGLLDAHTHNLRLAYTTRRNCLLQALTRYLPSDCSWYIPGGGYFVWIRLPVGINSTTLLPLAEAAGVAYLPGAYFYANHGGEQYMRLSFALLAYPEMEEGVRRLGAVLQQAIG